MKDLGYIRKPSDVKSPTVSSDKEADKKPSYPTFRANSDHRDAVVEAIGVKNLAIGTEVIVPMKLRICSFSDGEDWNKSVEFSVLSIGSPTKADEDEEEDDEEDENSPNLKVRLKAGVEKKKASGSVADRLKKATRQTEDPEDEPSVKG